MITIAYCIHNLGIGGAEMHLLTVFREMDRTRFRPMVVCLGNRNGAPLAQDYEKEGIPVIHLGMQGKPYSAANVRRLVRLRSLLVKNDVKILHGYLFEGNFLGVLTGRLAGVPVLLASKRSLDIHSPAQRMLCRVSNRLATRVTANSRGVMGFVRQMERCPKRKLVTIANGVNGLGAEVDVDTERERLRRRWNIPEEMQVVGTVARFFWKKGYEYFIRAAALLRQADHPLMFVAVGDGPLRPRVEALVRHLGIEREFLFLGWQPEGCRLLPLMDVYVCPSIIEGMSNAMLEAGSFGLPIVASAVGGNREIVVHGRTGLLVPPKDPAAIAEAVAALVQDPPSMKRMGENARKRVRKLYGSRGMVRKLEALYGTLLREAGVHA